MNIMDRSDSLIPINKRTLRHRYGIIWALFMGQNCVSPNGTVWAYRGPRVPWAMVGKCKAFFATATRADLDGGTFDVVSFLPKP